MTTPTVLITGGFGALGRVVAETLTADGHRVAILDRSEIAEDTRSLAPVTIGGCDLGVFDQTLRAVDEAVARLGRLDDLVCVAGGFQWQLFESGDLSAWEEMHRNNVLSAVHAAKAALPYLLQSSRGRIVNVAAYAALRGKAGMGPYAASKSALCRFTESLADEYKSRGITVNAVMPTIIDTPRNRSEMPDAEVETWIKPVEIARTIQFLVSPSAAAITGALIPRRFFVRIHSPSNKKSPPEIALRRALMWVRSFRSTQ